MFKKLVKKALALFSVKVTLLSKKNELLQWGINESNAIISEQNRTVYLKGYDITVDQVRQQYILRGFIIMNQLKEAYEATFSLDNNDLFQIKIKGLTIQIQTYEELFILNEIFINGIYNLSVNEKFVLIDIGMNVAIASLYFSTDPNCAEIYAFEPFRETFAQGQVNLALNPGSRAKIKEANFGLGEEEKTLIVSYDNKIKGNMGINGIPDHLSPAGQVTARESIEIRNAAKELLPIAGKAKAVGRRVVIKMDCEGSEYDIFRSFQGTHMLQQIDVIMLEWHAKGPEQLIADLKSAGFSCFSFTPKDALAGMLYAFK